MSPLRFNFRQGLHIEPRSLTEGLFVPSRTPYFSTAGPIVDTTNTLGLAAAHACIRLISESIGMMPMKIYQGEAPERTLARDSWQWFRLHEAPNDDQSAYDFWQDVAGSIETAGNTFIWKAIARRPIHDAVDVQLILIEPSRITLKRDDAGRRYYEVRRNGKTERVPRSQILHIRGWTATPGADLGLSPVAVHRETLGSALAAREYQARFFSNGTALPGFITAKGTPTQDQLDRYEIEWQQRHGGLANMHRPAILGNESGWISTGISMRDAQYIEIQQFNGEEVCRIFRVNPRMLGFQLATTSAEEDFERFLQADLGPRIRRIEMAVRRDPDLFPAGSELFPEFLTDAVLRPSIRTRFAAYKDALQAGFMMANEVREKENLPAVSFGDVIQQTPVGGAPNTPPKAAATSNGG